ncbi:MAG: molybdopterin cofactor-binding domain-containing protein [Thermodesulfobacteriota bacterium]
MDSSVSFNLNGMEVQVTERMNRRLLDVLRDDFNLIGVKEGCSEGVCGACSVIVNGALVQSCLTPLKRVQGGKVLTVEGLGSPEAPHPIQEAFVQAGAVQCGFCTPGMVLGTRVLLAGNPNPSRGEVVAALKGHLCRCTGYVKIIDAVLLAARLLQGKEGEKPSPKGIIGASFPRPEGLLKASGRARYGADIRFPGQLVAKVVRSPHHHARLLSLDCSEAVNLEGVVKVITGQDVPGVNSFGLVVKDQPVLAEGRVRWRGEPVALVVAKDQATATKAAALIKVEYQPLPALLTAEEAIEEGAAKIHDEGNFMPLIGPARLVKGDIERGFEESYVVVENTYFTSRNEHAYLEPEAGFGFLDEDGRVTVRLGTQSIYDDREDICRVLGLASDQVRVIQATTGGAFGGKYDPHLGCLLALAAYQVKKPVKIQYDRRESFLASVKRHPFRIYYKSGAGKDGRLKAIQVDYLADTGAYRACGPVVVRVAPLQATGPYDCPHVLISGKAVYTNNPPSSAMRGFGTPQFHFAFESQMDLLADKLGIDPLEFRQINALDVGQETVTGQVLTAGLGLKPTLAAAASHYRQLLSWKKQGGQVALKRGVGLACTWFGTGKIGRKDTSEAWADLTRQGVICFYSGAADCGQGQTSALRQIAAAELGLPFSSVGLVQADTALTPNAQSTVSSRILYTSGKAIRHAAQELKSLLVKHAARIMEESETGLQIEDGFIQAPSGRRLTFIELASILNEEGISLRGVGKYSSTSTLDTKTGKGAPYPTWCWGTHVVALEVNTQTGQVRLERVVAVHDVGKAINPMNIEGQIEGGIAMGLGFALKERFVAGQTRKLSDYHLPTMDDMPEIISILVEEEEPSGPFGAKGVGEPSLLPLAPAIANAIEDACGIRPRELPATAEIIRSLLSETTGHKYTSGAFCESTEV